MNAVPWILLVALAITLIIFVSSLIRSNKIIKDIEKMKNKRWK